jgi:recombination protein RecA
MSTLRILPALMVGDRRLQEIEGVVSASRLEVRPRPQTIPTGIAPVDGLTGGMPRGGLTEIFGAASSGRTTLLLSLLAQATAREEVCALIDTTDAFDPHSAAAAGVDLKRLLWVRCGGNPPQRHKGTGEIINSKLEQDSIPSVSPCLRGANTRTWTGRVEQALRALDLLLSAGGFGVLALDLADIPPRILRRIPLTSWFRFRRAVENTATALVVLEPEASAKSCASLVLKTGQSALSIQHSAQTAPTHARLLCGLQVNVEVLGSRMLKRKLVQSATASFSSRGSWAG